MLNSELGNSHDRVLHACFISPLGHGLYRPESGYAFGGAEVQFYLLAQELAKDPAFHISVLTTVSDTSGIVQMGRLAVIQRLGQRRLTGASPLSFIKYIKGCISAFRDMKEQLHGIGADVYFHAGAGVEVGAYALICRLLHRKFIFVVASPHDLCAPYGNVTGWLKWLYPLGVFLADAIVCRSLEQTEWLKDSYRREGVLIRTGHAVPTSRNSDQSTLLWVGRAHQVKQPELFVDLAEQLPQYPCTMVLMTTPESKDIVQHIQSRANAIANLTIHYNVHWTKIDDYFRQATLFVNTSTNEGFPNTFVQAALHGIPILSWTVDPDNVLTKHGIGVCANQSFDQLLNDTIRFSESESLRKEVGQQAYHYARTFHDLETASSRYKELVRNLIESGLESRLSSQGFVRRVLAGWSRSS